MPIAIGNYDSAAGNCVLLYDFSAGSYDGEPTINLFTQPIANSGFQIRPSNAARAFYKLDYYQDVSGQGTFTDNAPGPFLDTDSIYKYNFSSSQYDTNVTQTGGGNKHGFLINILRGETYTASVDVYVSTGHQRTGVQTVLSLNPNLSGSFTTISGSYDFDSKGTWQSIKQKVFVPSAINTVAPNPTYYEVSVATKTSQHPYYTSGSNYGFVIGNTQGRSLTFYKGGSYVFVQSNSSNVNDELYLSTTPNAGGGTNAYSNGFSYYGNKGFDGYAVFNVPYNAPPVIYYNSRKASSSYVGGKIFIVGGYNSGNTGNTGSIGSAGSGGSAGSSGSSGTTLTSESYAVCFDPTRGVPNSSFGNLSSGYILYKNMQFERNKKMFRGTIHKTQFTSSSRLEISSCVDLTGNNNSGHFTNSNYDSLAYLYFSRRQNLNDGSFVDVNLKNTKQKTFLVGSTKTQSFDFWFRQTATTNTKAFLLARSSGVSNDLFVENQGAPQLVYIQDRRVYFSFTSASNRVFAGYTEEIIDINVLYNVIISLNFNAVIGEKVKIYVNGKLIQTTVLSVLSPPENFNFLNVVSSVQILGNSSAVSEKGFKGKANQFYCISSYDTNGESIASSPISVPVSFSKKSIELTWDEVKNAQGYYIYRSRSSSFGGLSLLANLVGSRNTFFIDENFNTKSGNPKQIPAYNYFYDANTLALVDDSSAKICFGDYPVTTSVPNYFEGYIFRIGIYNTNISEKQAIRNYNSLLYKFFSGNPYLSREIFRPKSVIYQKVQF